MSIRRLALPLACAVSLLACNPASAQSVFAPSDDSSPGQAIDPFNPGAAAPSNDAQGIFAPAPDAPPARPVMQPRVAPQVQAPQPVPSSQRDDFAYRTLGIEVPKYTVASTDPLAGFTPEQIDTARRGFAAMEADNPQMIARNPFRTIDAMNSTQKAQDAMMARAKSACDVESFNILISPQSFMKDPAAVEGLTKNGVPLVGNIIQSLCSDREMRAKITSNLPMLTIVNRTGAQSSVTMTDGIITLTSDFASDQPPQPEQLRTAFVKAVDDTEKLMQGPSAAAQ